MKLSEEKMQYLKNIRQQLCKGTLSHEGAERLMLDAIEKEAEKESADYDWIEACCQFLDEDIPVDDVQADWPDHQQSNWAAIQSAIRQEQGTEKGASSKWDALKKVLVAAACLAIVLGGVSFSVSWYQGRQSDNGQIYDFTGQKVEVGNGQAAIAAGNGTMQELETNDYAEVVAFLGTTPPVPEWWPEGWEALPYYATLIDGCWSLSVYYLNPEFETMLSYSCVYATDPSTVSSGFPQDGTGETIVLENGKRVYFATNAGDMLAIWQCPNMYMNISGPITRSEITQMIYYVQGGNG